MFGYHSQPIIGQFIEGREYRSHNPSIGTVGSNKTYHPSQIGGQQETCQSQDAGPENTLLLRVTVLVSFLTEPSDNILHYT